MTYAPHALVQFGGTIASSSGPPEVWACGVRVVEDYLAGGYLSDPAMALANLAGPLTSWFFLTSNGMDSRAHLTWAKVNNIGPDGKYKDSVVHTANLTETPGGATSVGIPAFLSVCVTFETGFTRGLAHRGRIYLPNAIFAVTDDAHIAAADRTKVVNAGKNLLTALKAGVASSPTFKMQPVVASKRGPWKLITGVSADDVYDVQRRRKNRLTSTRSTVSFP